MPTAPYPPRRPMPAPSPPRPSRSRRAAAPLLAAALVLAGCVATAPATGPSNTTGAERQLRAAVDGPLRTAGISQECIDSLDVTALSQVRNLTQRSPRTSRDWIQRNQQLRTFVGQRYCPDL